MSISTDGILLSIETSGITCSVALHRSRRLIAYTELNQEKSHSGRLTLIIDELLRHSDLTMRQLTAVAVSEGPGSYTGLRIGISTAKGICFALGIPLLSVDTLQAMCYGVMAQSILPENVLLCPCVDARRMEIYRAVWDAHGQCLLSSEPHVLQADSFAMFSNRSLWFFGSGAAKTLAAVHHPDKHLLANIQPSARFVGEIALQYPCPVDIAYFEPRYIKPFQISQKKA